jgi:hypothetical protein
VIPSAKKYASTIDERQREAERQFRQYEEQVERRNEQGLRSLKAQCRRISVLLYRATGSGVAPGPSAPEASAPGGPGVEPASAGAMDSIDGRFRVDEKPADGLNPPAVARIRPVVTGEGGRPLPSRYHDEIVAGCEITEQNDAGLLLRSIRLQDVTVEKRTDVFEPAVAARVRFVFFPRTGSSVDRPPSAPVAAASHTIERIERGRQYTITLELSKATLDWLHLLAAEPESSEP